MLRLPRAQNGNAGWRAERAAAGRLDADHVGAEVGEEAADGRARQRRRQVDDAQPCRVDPSSCEHPRLNRRRYPAVPTEASVKLDEPFASGRRDAR